MTDNNQRISAILLTEGFFLPIIIMEFIMLELSGRNH